MKRCHLMILAAVLVLVSGCAHVPPTMVTRDRFDYGQAIGDSWKRQTLMNVVRIRYADAPVFLDVSSVINSYTLSGSANLGATIQQSPGMNNYGAGIAGSWSNTPTVTYQPLMGDKFSKSLLTPIPPVSVLQLMQAGWPVQMIFRIAVRSVNGLHNQSRGMPAEPEFTQLVDALARIQQSEAVGFRMGTGKEGDVALMVITREDIGAVKEDSQIVRKLLGLNPQAKELNVTFGMVPRNDQEVAMLTRSMLEIMIELGVGIDVPEKDLREARVVATPSAEARGGEVRPLVSIHSGVTAPADAYAAVNYRDMWFWIDDRDVPSKRTFTFLLILFSLAETGQAPAAPLITVTAGH